MPAAANPAFTIALILVAIVLLFPSLARTAQVDALYRAGVAARLEQRFDRAVDLLDRAVRLQPENADIWVQLALAQGAAGRTDEARTAFERAVILAPVYADAHFGLARLAFWRGDLDEAEQHLAAARRFGSGGEEAIRLEQQIIGARVASNRLWRLHAGVSVSDLSGGLPSWGEGTIALSKKLGQMMTATVAVKLAERFGAADSYFEGRIDYRFDQKVRAWLFAGPTPSADFLPQNALGIGASAKIGEDWEGFGPAVLSGEIAYFHYADDDVTRINPALQIYLCKGRAWVSLQGIATFSAKAGWSGGYVARGEIKLDDRLRIFAGYGDAPDLSDGEILASRAIFGGMMIALSDRVSAVFSLTRTELEGAYSRDEADFGISMAF